MSRLLAIAILAALLLSTVVAATTAADQKIHGQFAIQLPSTGPELKTLVAFDADVYITKVHGIGTREVEDGKYKNFPYKEYANSWRLDQTEKGFTIQVYVVAEKNHRYLSYDLEAPEKGVSLREKPTAGSYWDIDLGPKAGRTTNVRARNIEGGNWCLDYDRDGEEYLQKAGGARNVVTLYDLKLKKEGGADFEIDHYGK